MQSSAAPMRNQKVLKRRLSRQSSRAALQRQPSLHRQKSLSSRQASFQRQMSLQQRASLCRQLSNSLAGAAELGRLSSVCMDDLPTALVSDLTGDYYDDLTMLYNVAVDICTPFACGEARMIEVLMQRIGHRVDQLSHEEASSTNVGHQHEQLFQGILRVYSHMYQHHYGQMIELQVASTLDMCFQHLLVFLSSTKLADMAILFQVKNLVVQIRQQYQYY